MRGWCCSASCNPPAPCAMKGTRALTSVHVLPRLLPPQLHFQSGPEPSSQTCMSSSICGLSQRGMFAADRVNSSFGPDSGLSDTGTKLACSRWCCPTPDTTCLLYFLLFPAGSGNIYFINIYKKLKISLLFCHILILLCL